MPRAILLSLAMIATVPTTVRADAAPTVALVRLTAGPEGAGFGVAYVASIESGPGSDAVAFGSIRSGEGGFDRWNAVYHIGGADLAVEAGTPHGGVVRTALVEGQGRSVLTTDRYHYDLAPTDTLDLYLASPSHPFVEVPYLDVDLDDGSLSSSSVRLASAAGLITAAGGSRGWMISGGGAWANQGEIDIELPVSSLAAIAHGDCFDECHYTWRAPGEIERWAHRSGSVIVTTGLEPHGGPGLWTFTWDGTFVATGAAEPVVIIHWPDLSADL
jgi:hypothetical protein